MKLMWPKEKVKRQTKENWRRKGSVKLIIYIIIMITFISEKKFIRKETKKWQSKKMLTV